MKRAKVVVDTLPPPSAPLPTSTMELLLGEGTNNKRNKVLHDEQIVSCEKTVISDDGGDEVELMGTHRALASRNKIRETVAEMLVANGCAPEIDLTLGDPTKFGAPFEPPRILKSSLIDAINSNKFNSYGPAVGLDDSRKAIASTRNGAKFADVLIAGGCSSAIDLVLRSLAGPGDTVLVPCPGFPLYESLLKANGIGFKRYNLDPDNNFMVDLNHLASLAPTTPRIRAIFINNPANPSGTTFSLEHLHDIMKLIAEKFDPQAVVVADEIYENVVFSPTCKFYPMCDVARTYGVPIITVSGLSKGWCCPGWRVGWSIAHAPPSKPHALDDFLKASRQLAALSMGATTILQAVLPRLLQPTTEVDKAEIAKFRQITNTCLETCAQVFYDAMCKIPGIHPYRPTGAMYLFFRVDLAKFQMTSSLEFCSRLLKDQGVMLLPGECFGLPGFVRVSIAAPEAALVKCAAAVNTMANGGCLA